MDIFQAQKQTYTIFKLFGPNFQVPKPVYQSPKCSGYGPVLAPVFLRGLSFFIVHTLDFERFLQKQIHASLVSKYGKSTTSFQL